MPPAALLTLMNLQFRGQVRRALRGARTPKGAAFVVVGAAVVLLWLGPAVVTSFMMNRADPSHVRAAIPPILLAMALVSAVAHGGDKAVSFTPAEVNFLFPGPFTRRQLLVYKLTKSTIGAALTSLFLSLVLLRYATLWVACVAGAFLSMLFLQLVSIAIVLIRQRVEASAALWRRWAVRLTVFAVVALAAAPAAGVAMRRDWPGVLPAIDASPAARVVLAPVKPLARVWTAPTVASLAAWAAPAVAVNALLLLLVLRLDANLLEVSLEASRRQEQAMLRLRRGQVLNSAGGGARAGRLRVPMPPRLGGAGAVAWRQLTTALRTGRGLLLFVLIFAGAVLPGAIVGVRADGAIWAVFPITGWMTLILAAMMKFDFRADLDRMDALKALPMRPAVVAAGQLAAPAAVLAALHVVLFAGLAIFAPFRSNEPRVALLWAAAAAAPFDVLLIGVENLVFLLAPSRPAAATPGDLGAMGRSAMTFVVKALVLLVPCGVAGVFAAAVYVVSRQSVPATGAAVVVALAAQSAAAVWLVGRAFHRFDPSADVPA
jgi:hypothetical protein